VPQDVANQVAQAEVTGQNPGPGAQVDTGEDDFIGVGGGLDVKQEFQEWDGCAQSRAAGWYTEGTAVVATILKP